jgi:hypothetical protein
LSLAKLIKGGENAFVKESITIHPNDFAGFGEINTVIDRDVRSLAA